MVITNNVSANMILGNLNKNIKGKSKATKQLALAEKISSAGDDASTYAISEKMRVSIRALNQADANVQNGASMLRVAEGAIQSQINLLRTVKERVINAHNDTNTDADRLIIQKEITQYYDEINDIAAETTFNGKHLLLGNKVQDSVKSWFKLDHAEKLADSDTLSFAATSITTLDGQEGPFATFGASTDDVAFDGYNVKTVKTYNMSGGTVDLPKVVEISIPKGTSFESLDNTAFSIVYPGDPGEPSGEEIFVFSPNGTNKYRGNNVNVVNMANADSLKDLVATVAARIRAKVHLSYTTDSDKLTIRLTTVEKGDATNITARYDVKGITLEGGGIYTKANPLNPDYITTTQKGKDGATATCTMDLSSFSDVETVISTYTGQAIYHSGNNKTYEFIDSSKSPAMESIPKLNGSKVIDLNSIRSAVSSGKTVAEVFANLVVSSMGSSLATAKKNDSGQVTGIIFNATVRGEEGNSQQILFKKGDMRDYTIDFASVLSGASSIAGALDGKGFRFYSATNPNQWVNVLFVNGVNPNDDPRPASGTGDLDIDTFVVDVSDVTDVQSLIRTLYKGDGDKNPMGLNEFLSRNGQDFQIAADYNSGTVTIYDTRRYTVMDGAVHAEKGAKIANGIFDNVVNDYRNTYVNDLVIQHTDKSSANIHVLIPQTTMDHIFGYKIGESSLDDYSVLTSEKREMLLGQDYPTKVQGTLDRGLQYLIDANTLIGAQINHMENADTNLVTVIENTTAAESTMRDANMAKSAMDFAKYNILSQSTQAMLSQFNQDSHNVLNLLQ
ncbi:Flagellin protein FlaA [Anaerovibrio sp. JC8]|nr:Flagellin protein FlaA [Anaerovibrio sp. JC8]